MKPCISGVAVFIIVIGAFACKNASQPVSAIDYGSITTIRYSEHVQPIFNRSCAVGGCHDASTRAAGLALTSWLDIVRGSTLGEVLIPYRSSRSLLTLLFDGTPLRKPHPSIGNRSPSGEEVNFLKRWINEGAKNDQGEIPNQRPAHKLYVPNQGEDNVAIVDIDNLVVCKYVDVGDSPTIDGPHYVVADSMYWYVSLIGARQVWKFDARTDTVVGRVLVQGSPALLELTPDGSKLYVSQFTTSTVQRVFVVNTATMSLARSITVWSMPHGIRMNHAGTRLYVANMMSDNISVIDVATDSVLETVPVAWDANPFGPVKYMPMEIAVSPDDSLIIVTCSENREVRMFSTATHALVDSFEVGDQPWHLQFTPDGQFCYITNRRGHSVSVLHIPMRHVMETIGTPSPPRYFDYPHGCDITRDGRYSFVSNENAGHGFVPRYNVEYVGNVCVIDNLLNRVIKVLEVGIMPTGLSVPKQ